MNFFSNRQNAALKEMAKQIAAQMIFAEKKEEKQKAQRKAEKFINRDHEHKLQLYRPNYRIDNVSITCQLHKITVSQRDGRTIAYYDLKHRNKVTGELWMRRFIWAVIDGQPREIHAHDWRHLA